MKYNLRKLKATWGSLGGNIWLGKLGVNIDDNVWQFEVYVCVNEWHFVMILRSFCLAAEKKRTPGRSLKHNCLELAATWLSLGDNFWQL